MKKISQKKSHNFFIRAINRWFNWARSTTLEYMIVSSSNYAFNHEGSDSIHTHLEKMGAYLTSNPRHADILIILEPLTYKMAHRAKVLYEQMTSPKYIVTLQPHQENPFLSKAYSLCKSAHYILPVDFHIADYPKNPMKLYETFYNLKKKIREENMATTLNSENEEEIIQL